MKVEMELSDFRSLDEAKAFLSDAWDDHKSAEVCAIEDMIEGSVGVRPAMMMDRERILDLLLEGTQMDWRSHVESAAKIDRHFLARVVEAIRFSGGRTGANLTFFRPVLDERGETKVLDRGWYLIARGDCSDPAWVYHAQRGTLHLTPGELLAGPVMAGTPSNWLPATRSE